MKTFKHFFIEKTVIGAAEDVVISGVGKVSAKVDSGNSAYNVLHAIIKNVSGDTIKFTTVNDKNLELPVVGYIDINMGGGNIESRPVVELPMAIGPYTFTSVKFSLTDRSKNEHPVLLGVNFLRNIDAVIDVSKQNISHHQISVDFPDTEDL